MILANYSSFWTIQLENSPKNIILGPFRGQMGPFGVPGGPEEARYQAKVCGNHNNNPVRPVGGSWDQIWSLGVLQGPLGPPKGALIGPKRVLLGFLVAQKRPDTRPKCVNHSSSPVRPIGGSWDQIWSPWALRGPQGAQKGPFGAKTSPFGGPRSAVEVR